MNYKNSSAKENDGETLSVEDEKIRALLGTLNRVEAPQDFDFRVRARIAKAAPAARQTGFLPILRYILPLAAILLIASGFVFNSLYFADPQGVPTIAQIDSQPPPSAEKSIQTNFNQSIPAVIPQVLEEKEIAQTVSKSAANELKNKKIASDNATRLVIRKPAGQIRARVSPDKYTPGGGRRLSAVSPPDRIITSSGINLNKTTGNSSDFEKTKNPSVKELLLQLGAQVGLTGGSWKVLTVRENSLAKSSGIRTGDVIEAVDGEKLTDKPLPNKKNAVKQLTVDRGGQKIEIPIGIKPN